MALQQIATAAVRLVRVTSLTDGDADVLVREFQLHPHDREALFSVPTQPLVRSYRGYSLMVLPWPIYDVAQNDLRSAAFRLIVAADRIAIISDESLMPVEEYWRAALTILPVPGQSAPLAASSLLLQLTKWTAASIPLFLQQLSPSLDDADRVRFVQALNGAGQAVSDFDRRLKALGLDGNESTLTFRLAGHLLTHAAGQLAAQHRSPTRRVDAPAVVLPRLIGGYALVSAIVALLTIIAVR